MLHKLELFDLIVMDFLFGGANLHGKGLLG